MPARAYQGRADEPLFEDPPRFSEPYSLFASGRCELRWQRARVDRAALWDTHRKRSQNVLELSHVTGPGVRTQRRDRGTGKRCTTADPKGGFTPAPLHQKNHIFPALPERRQCDADNVEPVQEIHPEAAGSRFGRQVAVRRRHQSHVNPARYVLADSPELSLLNRAKNLGLSTQGEFTDLV
jgi:hypothetical protein